MPNHFVKHLMDTVSVMFRKFRETISVNCCRFLQSPVSISPVPRWRLAPCPLLLISAPHDHLEGCGRRRRAGGGAPPVSDGSGGFAAAREGRSIDGAVQRRPSHRRPPRGRPLPRARCHPRLEPLGAELSAAVVPVRPPHHGPAPLRQDRPGLAGERHQ